MPNWKFKALIQGTISRLPDPQRWNRLFQKYATGSLSLDDDYLISKWRQAAQHARHYRDHGGATGSFCALELGTGWFPINPIGLALSGASRVYTIDRQALFQKAQLTEVLQRYRDLIEQGRIEPADGGQAERLAAALDVAGDETLGAPELLEMLGVRSIVGDARATSLETGSIDLICSNNTLEHIPGDVIAGIFGEFRRLLKPGGLMSHHIDLSDHYSHFDRSITVYNFLRFSQKAWQRYNNDLLYQNRLRLSDYSALHDQGGWQVIGEESQRKPPGELRSVPLAEEFRDHDPMDLAVYNTWMLSVPKAGAP